MHVVSNDTNLPGAAANSIPVGEIYFPIFCLVLFPFGFKNKTPRPWCFPGVSLPNNVLATPVNRLSTCLVPLRMTTKGLPFQLHMRRIHVGIETR